MDLKGIIQIGTVVNSHGNKGELKVIPLTDDPDIFLEVESLILSIKNKKVHLNLIGARETKKFWLLQFDGINDISSALSYKGAGVFTEEENVRPLDEDEFFIHDLIDAKVYSTNEEYLGTIINYFETGSQGICEVKTEDDSFLFPTSAEILVEVIPSEKVVINLVPDLIDLNKRKS